MRILDTIRRVPGGLMIVPLALGALVNTIDQAHIPAVMAALKWLGAQPVKGAGGQEWYEFLRIGGFAEALFSSKAILTLIALFLFCAGSQMDLRVGGRAMKKGVLLTAAKYGVGVAIGLLVGRFFDPFAGVLGLSTLAIIAAMTNGNGGMFVALTGQYGNRSDVGAVAVLSLNDGPFFTLMALSLMGDRFPIVVFLAVLLPIGLGMLLGNLDKSIREFLKPGETLVIPFFAFALGTGLNLAIFLNPAVAGPGMLLGVATTVLTGLAGITALWLFRERSTIAAVAEASTAGNAAGTPALVAAAALVAANAGQMAPEIAAKYQALVPIATAQIGVAVLTTAVLCPIAVILWDKWQRACGIDARDEGGARVEQPEPVAAG